MGAIVGKSSADAVKFLREGFPVALPTETVYGLAAPLSNIQAIESIYRLKERPANNPLIVHVLDFEQLDHVAYTSPLVKRLVNAFWPGPLTLVLPKKNTVPPQVTAQQASVAVRAPQAPLFREVLRLLGEPLVAPSANKFQQVSPTCAAHVLEGMGDVLQYILDGGSCKFGLESTILSLLDSDRPEILRYGPIGPKELESVLGSPVYLPRKQIWQDAEAKLSPGLFKKHYSPKTPLFLVNSLDSFELSERFFNKRCAYIHYRGENQGAHYALTTHDDIYEAANNLYALLQQLDAEHYDVLFAELAPSVGIGLAINDRLQRAGKFLSE